MLHKVIKPVSPVYFAAGPSGFRRHAFPDISRAIDPNREETSPREHKFQRIYFDAENTISLEKNGSAIWKNDTPEEEMGSQALQAEKEGYLRGLRKGEEEAFARVKPETDALLQLLRKGRDELANLRKKSCREMERETVELALAVARKILCREIRAQPEAIFDILREALVKAADTAEIKIRLNPSDLRLIESRKSELSRDFNAGDMLVFEADETLARGGCYIETDFGDIEARLEQQILSVETALRKEWEDCGEIEEDSE